MMHNDRTLSKANGKPRSERRMASSRGDLDVLEDVTLDLPDDEQGNSRCTVAFWRGRSWRDPESLGPMPPVFVGDKLVESD